MPALTAVLIRLAPLIFAVLWSSGWIVAKFAAFGADPLTFLTARYALAAISILLLTTIIPVNWPRAPMQYVHAAMLGVLMHAIYLASVWWAVGHGVPAGVSGLIAALQPLLTAVMAGPLLGERVGLRQWAGLAAGLIGILLVLEPRLVGVAPEQLRAIIPLIVFNVVGMIAVTSGTFYQKRFLPTGDLLANTAIQYVIAFTVTLPFAYWLEPMRFDITPTAMWTMAWSVLVLSIGAVSLLYVLIRRGEVSRTATYIYLVPPLVAIEAFVLFGERLQLIQIVGMAVTSLGVFLATRR